MSETKPLQSVPLVPLPPKRELVVVPQEPTLEELTAAIRKGHRDVEAAAGSLIKSAMQAGETLKLAKRQVGHGNFEEYVAERCGFSIRTAQNYMKLAKYKRQINEWLARKNAGHFVSISEVLKYIDKMRLTKPPKK